jgi:signal transduction histidine kinase
LNKVARHSNATLRDLVRPFWVLCCIATIGIMSLAGLVTYALNQNAVTSSEHLFSTALSAKQERLGELLLEYGYWDEAVENLADTFDAGWATENLGPYLYKTLGVSQVHVLDGADASVFSSVEGEAVNVDPLAMFGAPLRALIAQARSVEDNTAPVSASGIVKGDGLHHIMSTIRMTTYGTFQGKEVDISTDHVMIFAVAMDDDILAEISEGYLLPNLRISAEAPALWESGFEILTPEAADPAYFVWQPPLPGTELLPNVIAGVIAIFGIMGGAAFWFVRRARGAAMDLERALAAADNANNAKTDFLRNVAHEVRTPINAIIGFSEIMQRRLFGPLGSEKYEEYVDDISKTGSHMLTLVSDLLDLEKIEAGAIEVSVTEAPVDEALTEVVAMMRETARKNDIRLETELPEALPVPQSDPKLIRQMLLNLLGNAIKFTPQGGQVTCRAFVPEPHWIALQISDTGRGMHPHQIPKVLEPFGQIDGGASHVQRGSGLGLPITRKLAERLGGSLVLESAIDHGTTATIRLPTG